MYNKQGRVEPLILERKLFPPWPAEIGLFLKKSPFLKGLKKLPAAKKLFSTKRPQKRGVFSVLTRAGGPSYKGIIPPAETFPQRDNKFSPKGGGKNYLSPQRKGGPPKRSILTNRSGEKGPSKGDCGGREYTNSNYWGDELRQLFLLPSTRGGPPPIGEKGGTTHNGGRPP